jgi:hypothetical protein
VYSGQRCHAHYLAKERSLIGMVGELHGKKIGCAKGPGESVHLHDPKARERDPLGLPSAGFPAARGSLSPGPMTIVRNRLDVMRGGEQVTRRLGDVQEHFTGPC